MGKVGSSAVQATVESVWRGTVDHSHGILQIAPGARAELEICRRLGLRSYFITPVRDPVSRAVSAFFQNFTHDTGLGWSDAPASTAEMVSLFLEKHRSRDLHWFDRFVKAEFGFDVFATPFDRARRWQAYSHGAMRVLVYRTDLARTLQLEAVSGFLGVRIPAWVRRNESSDKNYAKLYADFCREAVLPRSYIDEMHGSRFARHFWTEEELDGYARQWSAR